MNHGKNLYIAIVTQALEDMASIVKRAKHQQDSKGYVDSKLSEEMITLDNEMIHEWFHTCCLLGDVDPTRVKSHVRGLKEMGDWNNLIFVSLFNEAKLRKMGYSQLGSNVTSNMDDKRV